MSGPVRSFTGYVKYCLYGGTGLGARSKNPHKIKVLKRTRRCNVFF